MEWIGYISLGGTLVFMLWAIGLRIGVITRNKPTLEDVMLGWLFILSATVGELARQGWDMGRDIEEMGRDIEHILEILEGLPLP